MILSRTGLLELNYDEKHDTLRISWPDISLAPPAEVEHSVRTLADSIIQYDIKRLLIDSRGPVSELDEQTYRNVLLKLMQEFRHTRLQKIARLSSSDFARENRVQKVAGELSQQQALPIEFRSFTSETDALLWLQE